MITIGTMNILDSFTPCYLTTGPFLPSAVNYNAGCKAAMLNVVMSLAVIVTLLFLTPLFTTPRWWCCRRSSSPRCYG